MKWIFGKEDIEEIVESPEVGPKKPDPKRGDLRVTKNGVGMYRIEQLMSIQYSAGLVWKQYQGSPIFNELRLAQQFVRNVEIGKELNDSMNKWEPVEEEV